METRLQSSEVRIPKDYCHADTTNTTPINASTTFNISSPSISDDSTMPQQDATPSFQSSFARSLSFHTTNHSQSLDIGLNFHIGAKAGENLLSVFQPDSTSDPSDTGISSYTSLKGHQHHNQPPPLPTSSPPNSFDDREVYGSHSLQPHDITDNQRVVRGGHGAANNLVPTSATTPNKQKNGRLYMPSTTPKRRYMTMNGNRMPDAQSKSISTDCEVLRLRKECQGLIEENRRLISAADRTEAAVAGGAGGHFLNNGNVHRHQQQMGSTRSLGPSVDASSLQQHQTNVESVVLQTQVETLQWQLKQVESSRQMYHAVMEEVVRFLERCHHSLGAHQQPHQSPFTTGAPIARSKSVNHVFLPTTNTHNHSFSANQQLLLDLDVGPPPAKGRHRTSTRIMTDKPAINARRMTSLEEQLGNVVDTSTIANDSFANYTWRRSPKSTSTDNSNADPAKLSSEAFRLLRTVQSLLNLRDPVLAETTKPTMTTSLDPLDLHLRPHNRSTTPPPAFQNPGPIHRQALNRDSRLSMQSSTDDSVHSTSSSRHETEDEESNTNTNTTFCMMRRPAPSVPAPQSSTQSIIRRVGVPLFKMPGVASSSADEESGFSSMNSFQEIGLPTHPAPVYNPPPRSRLSTTSTISSSDQSRCSTTNQQHTTSEPSNNTYEDVNIVKLRCDHPSSNPTTGRMSLPVCHRRWSSAPPIPPRTLSTFNIGADEPLKVLWV